MRNRKGKRKRKQGKKNNVGRDEYGNKKNADK
jgi:hypothetical protein